MPRFERYQNYISQKLYKVFATQGQGAGEDPVYECVVLTDALNFVKEHKNEASFAIKYPTGEFHDWDTN